ncbi:ribokinase [Kineosporia sp. NBRC 101677]|uniref:PfkB family carbohydrate kinase n=1 Tax=Kineosporia sp. NBRC 101677 TaxID=3032197 RepID=UPI0024A41DD3|nr:PfkB family carbohydrate kinase [Kineosporia sp. NBRC 101677]GLY15962.1 ribokinase [Kineosporia sp. NBRC 101677]
MPTELDVAVLGQIGRDLVLQVQEWPEPGGAAPAGRRLEMLGGKGANQAVGMAQLGLSVGLVAVVGDDRTGEEVLAAAASDGIDVSSVVRRSSTSTALLLDLVEEGGHRRLVEDVPEGTLLTPEDIAYLLPSVLAASTVVLQMQQPAESMTIAARAARAAGRRIVLDGAVPNAELLALADVLRADEEEASSMVDDFEDPVRAATELQQRHALELVVLAAGKAGNAVAWPGGQALLPLEDDAVVDQTGAGDAWIAGLTAGLVRGLNHRAAAELGASAAERTVQRLGGRPDLTSLLASTRRW